MPALNADENVEQQKLSVIAGGNENGETILEDSWVIIFVSL